MNLKRLREMEAAATKGPWKWDRDYRDMLTNPDDDITIIRVTGHDGDLEIKKADSDFIAETRNQMPELLIWIEQAKVFIKETINFIERDYRHYPLSGDLVSHCKKLLEELGE